jgi:general secretion pathway protein J
VRKQNQAGFTLIEIIVAVGIFAIVSGAGYAALEQALAVQARLNDERDYWRQLEFAMAVMQRDFAGAIDRPPRAVDSRPVYAFQGDATGASRAFNEVLAFTKETRSDIRDKTPRPATRVSYHLKDGVLSRREWSRVDQPARDGGAEQTILRATNARFRYLARGGRWHRRWPVDGGAMAMPLAVEITFSEARVGPFKRVLPVSVGG